MTSKDAAELVAQTRLGSQFVGSEMKTFSKVEHISVYDTLYRRSYDRYPVLVNIDDVAVLMTIILGVAISLMMWTWSMWRLPSKAGYQGVSRFLWFLFLVFPPTFGCSLLAFMLVTWPVQKELEKSKAQLDELRRLKRQPKHSTAIDDELEQLRRQMQQ